ncbi:ATP-dependent dethiobiotin synthetase BioD [Prescottella agglutinans]|uniref:ATP-dependent dethiobiotin synthetase BioD n=1 Tax=Prescottella agglutinans TaxID=1644129 RepID=A0A438BDK9_9NOCA|nr:dethiobiotin synthase [Prescottella agglutinans]RVW09058.1 ATP-dependent dethiobiotin synthetase BioD [Prescottella agglutinans]
MSILVVSGTSTDVGKTVVTAALAAALRAAGRSVAVCKPAQTGVGPDEPGDLAEVARLSGVTATVELARYPEPLAPDTAARRAGMPLLTRAQVVAAARDLDARHDVTLVEGAGGLLVRLGADGFTVRDVAADLAAPVVVVAAAGLGTLNHCALTAESLASAGVKCGGFVVGSWPEQPDLAARCNLDDLPAVTGAALVGRVPEGVAGPAAAQFAEAATGWFEPEWLATLIG